MASQLASGRELVLALAESLGIDPKRGIRSIVINADCREFACVTIELIPSLEEMEKVSRVLKHYGLTFRDPLSDCQ